MFLFFTLCNLSQFCTAKNLQALIHRIISDELVFVVMMTGYEKKPAVSSWEETQLECLTPDTAAVQTVGWLTA